MSARVQMIDVYRIWDDPQKGDDAADAQAQMLVEAVWEAIKSDHLVDVPTEQVWYEGHDERRVLRHRTKDGPVAWVFSQRQKARSVRAASSEQLDQALLDAGLTREPSGWRTKAGRDQVDVPIEPKDGPPWSHLDMDAVLRRFQIGADGVVPMSYDSRSKEWHPNLNGRICQRPIWPEQAGRDLSNGDLYWDLGWIDQWGRHRTEWISDVDMRSAVPLIQLTSGPVTDGKQRHVADWLSFATGHVDREMVDVTSRVGWIGARASMRWVWPGGDVKYIGPDLQVTDGDRKREAWKSGLTCLLDLGEAGFTSLAAVAISAAAPLSRVHQRRNPILGYASRTSRGKGSAMGFACSLWCNPDALMAPASSTAKGIQDRGNLTPDLPLWLDELQQLLEQGDRGRSQAMDSIYYLANGVRRVTSSKEQKAKGGERRFGCGMYAAESTILEGLNAGVQSRVIELTSDPCPAAEVAIALQQASRAYGAWAALYGAHLQAKGTDHIAASIETYADALRADVPADSGLRGDDCDTIAIVCIGLQLLGEVLEVEMPIAELDEWLRKRLIEQRRRQVDKELDAMQRMIDLVLGSNGWSEDDGEPGIYKPSPNCPMFTAPADADLRRRRWSCKTAHGVLAWRSVVLAARVTVGGGDMDTSELGTESLEINTSHESVQRLLSEYGGETRIRSAWNSLGWLITDGRHLKVKKTWKGRSQGRVLRLSAKCIEEVLRD